jgi:hypothetical protein
MGHEPLVASIWPESQACDSGIEATPPRLAGVNWYPIPERYTAKYSRMKGWSRSSSVVPVTAISPRSRT